MPICDYSRRIAWQSALLDQHNCRRFGRISRIICLACTALVLGIPGCDRSVTAGPDMEHATTVSFEQFRKATAEEEKFFWLGSDTEFHYFETSEGFYRISSGLEMPQLQNRIDLQWPPGTTKWTVRIDGDTIGGWSSRLQKPKDGAGTDRKVTRVVFSICDRLFRGCGARSLAREPRRSHRTVQRTVFNKS